MIFIDGDKLFSGIIREIGEVTSIVGGKLSQQLEVQSKLFVESQLGDSVAVSGVCLTVAIKNSDKVVFDVSSETLRKTSLGNLSVGGKVNLESPLTLSTLLHGHIVQGHVDGVGEICEIEKEGETYKVVVKLASDLLRYFVPKGSVTVDGVSLTVGQVHNDRFSLFIIPKTWQCTTFQFMSPKTLVNIEIDILAKYVERLFQSRTN